MTRKILVAIILAIMSFASVMADSKKEKKAKFDYDNFKILKDGHGSVSRGLTPRPATGANEGARLQAQHCKPIWPPGRVS